MTLALRFACIVDSTSVDPESSAIFYTENPLPVLCTDRRRRLSGRCCRSCSEFHFGRTGVLRPQEIRFKCGEPVVPVGVLNSSLQTLGPRKLTPQNDPAQQQHLVWRLGISRFSTSEAYQRSSTVDFLMFWPRCHQPGGSRTNTRTRLHLQGLSFEAQNSGQRKRLKSSESGSSTVGKRKPTLYI